MLGRLAMNDSDLKTKVLEEIEHIPADQLSELYNLVHSFRLSSESNRTSPQSIVQFAGCWSELPNEIYADWLDDISCRRQQAFSQRTHREARPD